MSISQIPLRPVVILFLFMVFANKPATVYPSTKETSSIVCNKPVAKARHGMALLSATPSWSLQ